jgi:glycosyltransferase involved in cell wall biosynthesis
MLIVHSPTTDAAQYDSESPPHSSAHRIKIAHLVHDLSVGGAELLAANIARNLRHCFDFVFLCTDREGSLAAQLRAEGFPVHVLNRRPGIDWRCLLRLRRTLNELRFDLLHSHQYTQFFVAAIARRQLRPTPILFTEHGRHFPDVVSGKRRFGNRLLLRKYDRVVGVGEAVREALQTQEGLPSRRIEVVYNGVPANVEGTSGERRTIRRELRLTDENVIVMQVGRLDLLKDHDTALRAFALMHAADARARLILVGDGPERSHLESTVRELNLNGVVQFLGTRHDVARLLHTADISFLTSVSEGIPLTLLEAMAAGVPVVATRVGGVGEIVVDELTGMLSPARDQHSLARHLLRLAADPILRSRLGQAGLQRVRERFSLNAMISEYERLYREMSGRS